MFLAALAFVAAALVQLQIDVRSISPQIHTDNNSIHYFFNIACHTYVICIILICSLAFQETLPKFPTGVAGQIKFLNLDTNQVILNINGGEDSPVQPFKVH